LLVKGDHPVRGRQIPVPLVPPAALARVALLGGFGNLAAAMDRFIPAAQGTWGRAFWRLTIETQDGAVVRRERGLADLVDDCGTALAELWWDGRDDAGVELPAGRYSYTFEARFLAFDQLPESIRGYDDAAKAARSVEAHASTDEVVIRHDLSLESAAALRASKASPSCQLHQNSPLEPAFGFNYYYGSTHAHSNFSDGGQPTGACSSGNSYGSGTYGPADVYAYRLLPTLARGAEQGLPPGTGRRPRFPLQQLRPRHPHPHRLPDPQWLEPDPDQGQVARGP
jgi:hypothetical protein